MKAIRTSGTASAAHEANMADMLLRPYQDSDLVEVLAINLSSRPHVANLTAEEVTRLVDVGCRISVAVAERIFGYLIVIESGRAYEAEEYRELHRLLDSNFLYIDQVAVASAGRHMGVGRTLYDHAALDARQRGLESLCCEVNLSPPNEASMAFHEAMGFKTLRYMHVSGNRRIALMNRDF